MAGLRAVFQCSALDPYCALGRDLSNLLCVKAAEIFALISDPPTGLFTCMQHLPKPQESELLWPFARIDSGSVTL